MLSLSLVVLERVIGAAMLRKDALMFSLIGLVGLYTGGLSIFFLFLVRSDLLLCVFLHGVIVSLSAIFAVFLFLIFVYIFLPYQVD